MRDLSARFWHDRRVFCFPPQPDYRPADRVTEMFLLPFIATSLI